jgi:prepilin-type N-terminal cleavage/methylation domain-containing protein
MGNIITPPRSLIKNKKGFTLVELIVVVAIIGILIAIAVPLYGNITEKAEARANEANIKLILGAIEMFRAENGFNKEPVLEELGDYIDTGVKPPKGIGGSYEITYSEGKPSVEPKKAGETGSSE